MLIGVMEQTDFAQSQVRLAPGDILVLHTDGVTEARYDGGELFGEERLAQLIRSSKIKNVMKVPELIFDEINEYTHGNLGDDVVVLAVGLR